MTPEDKLLAREALEKKLMTIEQVTACKMLCESSGRSFAEIARERGWLKPPPPRPAPPPKPAAPVRLKLSPAYSGTLLVLAVSFTIMFSVVILLWWRHREEKAQLDRAQVAKETRRLQDEATLAVEEKIAEKKRQEAVEARDRARQNLLEAEDALRRDRDANVEAKLAAASTGYSSYLLVYPTDTKVLIERARTHELRRALREAIRDLERAVALDPSLGADLNPRIDFLRKFLPRND